MKLKPINVLALAMLAGFVWLSGCRDKSVKPFNPCLARKPLFADFKVEEDFGYVVPNWKYYSTDTVVTEYVRFTAKDSIATKFEWQIGSGIYTDRSFTLTFPPEFLTIHESIDITLTIHKKPDALCFPDDDSVKTLTKKIYFTDFCTGLYKGSFYGYLEEDTTKKFTITIDPCYWYNNDKVIRMDNFPQNCPDSNFIVSYYVNNIMTYRKFTFGGNGCYHPSGTGYILNDNKTLILEYTTLTCLSPTTLISPECGVLVKHKFIGVRKN
ncbi:MAG: hypothetical protein JST48_02930 [Bacteroidetes bacterium]|nr:hypothetical protein [Bacteroidota bacterium]